MRSLGAMGLIVLCASCASITKEQCNGTNWRKLGYNDALEGKTLESFNQDRIACARDHKIKLSTKAKRNYIIGMKRGLKKFCTYDRGYEFGKDNSEYLDNCPIEAEIDFLTGYEIGKKEYELSQREMELNNREYELRRQEEELEMRDSL